MGTQDDGSLIVSLQGEVIGVRHGGDQLQGLTGRVVQTDVLLCPSKMEKIKYYKDEDKNFYSICQKQSW